MQVLVVLKVTPVIVMTLSLHQLRNGKKRALPQTLTQSNTYNLFLWADDLFPFQSNIPVPNSDKSNINYKAMCCSVKHKAQIPNATQAWNLQNSPKAKIMWQVSHSQPWSEFSSRIRRFCWNQHCNWHIIDFRSHIGFINWIRYIIGSCQCHCTTEAPYPTQRSLFHRKCRLQVSGHFMTCH